MLNYSSERVEYDGRIQQTKESMNNNLFRMEKEYSRNQRSYRPRRNDSREDYRNNNERQERSEYGQKRVRREYTGNRYENNRSERNSEQNPSYRDRRNTNFNRENNRERPSYTPNRREDDRPARRVIARKEQQGNTERRPRVFRKTENSNPEDNRRKRVEYKDRSFKKEYSRERPSISEAGKEELRKKHYSKKKILAHRLKNENANAEIRLNRFISMGGVCSRRDADQLIVEGRVKVNGEVVQTVGQKVKRTDKVEVDEVQITPEKKIYLVLNKPKDYVTTVEDPLERKTVMSLIEGACKERVYPVGRLDRQTTGVLLFTNDGDLAKKLTHPKYDHKKIYHVFLDKPLEENDFEAIATGVDLEDGFIKADEINYTSPDRTEVGIEIHSGKNRIVRRIFEHFGYQIVKLDRVYFAGITKKNIPRGRWRFLTSREINMLKVY